MLKCDYLHFMRKKPAFLTWHSYSWRNSILKLSYYRFVPSGLFWLNGGSFPISATCFLSFQLSLFLNYSWLESVCVFLIHRKLLKNIKVFMSETSIVNQEKENNSFSLKSFFSPCIIFLWLEKHETKAKFTLKKLPTLVGNCHTFLTETLYYITIIHVFPHLFSFMWSK